MAVIVTGLATFVPVLPLSGDRALRKFRIPGSQMAGDEV
jgi:hypothetical protein